MMELELHIIRDGTPPLSVLATAKLAGFSLSVHRSLLYMQQPVLVLDEKRKIGGTDNLLLYLSRNGTGIPNLYDRDVDSETTEICDWLQEVWTLFDGDYEGVCKRIDDHLLQHTFLVGGSISVADIRVWSYFAGDGQRLKSLMKSTEYQNLARWYKMISTEHGDLLKELTETSSEKEDSGKEQGLDDNEQPTNGSEKVPN